MTTYVLPDPVIGLIIRRVESCTSTNDLARALAEADAPEGTAVVAHEQIQGRGTQGRSWHSAKNKGLYLSVVLRPRNPCLTLLPLAAGLAAADAIRLVCGFEPKLKWPNDIMANGKKLGGILIEAGSWGNRQTYAILGVGLNVSQKPEDFPEEIRSRAASLTAMAGEAVDTEALLRSLLASLDVRYREFNDRRNENVVHSFQSRMIFPVGQPLTMLTDAGPRPGRFAGLDARGGLILDEGGDKSVFYSGEIAAF